MDLPIGNEGSVSVTTAVEILAAPSTSSVQRVVLENGCAFFNADDVTHNVSWIKAKSATDYPIQVDLSVAVGAVVKLTKPVVLDATDESLRVVMTPGVNSVSPTFDAAAMETS